MSMRRFRVAEHSMVPTLLPGEEFMANTLEKAHVGDVVAVQHPGRPDFWLVKRLAAVPADIVETGAGARTLGAHEAWVVSDSQADGARDSRHFGPVDIRTVFPVVCQIDQTNFHAAVEFLVAEDDDLSLIVDRFGLPEFWARPRGFRTLTILILEQQVSLESAAAVFRRLRDLAGEISAEDVGNLSEDQLNRLGVTRQKSRYILDLARLVNDGSLDFADLAQLETAEARDRLLEIRGVGPWTAEAYLLSAEGRPD
ncbi:MAG TPA: S26 family signal peptidase, partial [Acidimicrobiia bacterium]